MSTQLRDALLATFGDKPFDATSVVLAMRHNAQLAAAVTATVPSSRYRLRPERIRRTLKGMARQYFNTDAAGYWTIKPLGWPAIETFFASAVSPKQPV
jgi:hypothetical protein